MNHNTTFVALDAHKKDHKVAMLLPGTTVLEEWTIPNNAREVKRMVQRIKKKAPGPVVVAYEAGVCGFALQRQIQGEGVTCQVIAPSLIPIQPGERIKTDRRDAAKLVHLLQAGMLTEVHPPDPQQEALRDLCRSRQAAVEDLTRIRHQLSKFLLRRGLIYTQGRPWTQTHQRYLAALTLESPLDQATYADYLSELDRRTERVAGLERRLEAAAQQAPYQEPVGWLRCFRGIDTLSAITILAELFGFERFASPRHLMSYLGLTPSEHSSGTKERKGGITKAGNRQVRVVLIEAGWHQRHLPLASKTLKQRRQGQPDWVVQIADKAMKRLHQRYWRLLNRGKPPVKAVTAVARELAGFIWEVLWTWAGVVPESEDAQPELTWGSAPNPAI